MPIRERSATRPRGALRGSADPRRGVVAATIPIGAGAVEGSRRATELIYCWDPDGPADPRGFARADHCDHIHWGMDG